MLEKIQASIIIPVYNQEQSLDVVLQGFSMQTLSKSVFEIIIIDDGSTDELRLKNSYDYQQYGLNIKLIHQKNHGRAYARNKGVALSAANIIIFCDADRFPKPNFVEEHLYWHQKGKKVIIGIPYDYYGSILEGISVKTDWIEIENLSRLPKYYSRIFGIFSNKSYSNSNLNWLSFLVGNSSVEKTDFIKSGGFDESFVSWGFEHFEFAFRLRKDVNTFYLNRNAINFHIPHKRIINFYSLCVSENIDKICDMHPEINKETLTKVLNSNIKLELLENEIYR